MSCGEEREVRERRKSRSGNSGWRRRMKMGGERSDDGTEWAVPNVGTVRADVGARWSTAGAPPRIARMGECHGDGGHAIPGP